MLLEKSRINDIRTGLKLQKFFIKKIQYFQLEGGKRRVGTNTLS